ncbi:nurim [Synchiropus picturatus]
MASVAACGGALSALSLLNFAFVFISGVDFIGFISFRAIYHNITGETTLCRDSVAWSTALQDGVVLKALVVDLGLLVLFIGQHCVLSYAPIKEACKLFLGDMYRSVSCFSTALVLQILMCFWQPLTGAPCLWAVRQAPWSVWFPLVCFTVHFMCWAMICSSLIVFDFTELLGLKQVYKFLGFGDLLPVRSAGAERLLSHVGLPVFLEMCVVLWLLPALSLDRFLLALTLTAYQSLAHSLDKQDLDFLSDLLKGKMELFAELH